MNPIVPIRLVATETREGLKLSLDAQYSGNLPNAPARKKAALQMARRIVAELEAVVEAGDSSARLTEIGHAANGQTKARRDDYLIEKGG